ncbi:MAG: hypothetical protein LBL76_06345 [Treponema sp.]|nr:hypothetical protein [Treponema sp.]
MFNLRCSWISKFYCLLRFFYGMPFLWICLLVGCNGGLDMVLSNGQTYMVNAYINDYSLSECSIIRSNDTIRPYFVNSLVNDPDIRGLAFFLQNPSRQAVSQRIWYTLTPGLTSPPETLETPPPPAPVAPNPETSPVIPWIPEPEVPVEEEKHETPIVEVPVIEAPEVKIPVIVQPEVVQEPELAPWLEETAASEPVSDPPRVITPELPAETGETQEEAQAIIEEVPAIIEEELISLVQDAPEFMEYPLPPELVFNPDIPDIFVLEKSESRNRTLTPGVSDRVISVARLDRDLPGYKLTESLEIGQYTLVFQVLGERLVLATIELPVYFLGNAQFNLEDIQQYLPGLSKAAHFVPPGIKVLFEAQVSADTRFDPYIIWYSGKTRISEGKLSESARYLFWQAPERTGFYTIKAALFPFKPPQNIPLYGQAKELSLPVSVKSEIPGYFSDQADQFIHWYQFQNNLLDAQGPKDPARSLRSKNQQPHWSPYGSIYGLSIGPKDIYLLPGSSFLLADAEQGSGQILFHAVLLAQGTIFKAVFISDTASSEALDVELSFNGKTLILRLRQGDLSHEEALFQNAEALPSEGIPLLQTRDFVTFSMNFTIQKTRFTAQAYLEDLDIQSKPCTITLSAPISGNGTFQFGSETALPDLIPGAKTPSSFVAIFNEVGISFTKSTSLQYAEWAAPDSESLPIISLENEVLAEAF